MPWARIPRRFRSTTPGLNHLGWLRGLRVDGRDELPRLLADAELLGSFEEGRLFGADWLQSLGAIPNEYLHYYYFNREAVRAYQEAKQTRGAFLHEQQATFYAEMERPDAPALRPGTAPAPSARPPTWRTTARPRVRASATPATWSPAATSRSPSP